MNLAILSDMRYPTRVDFGGHGLGRSVARLGKALAQRGHTVVIYAKGGSWVEGCTVVEDVGEGDDLAEHLLRYNGRGYSCFIDSTHQFRPALALQAEGYPVIAKVCDREYPGIPPNAVYGTSHHARQHDDLGGLVIPEGLDVDEIPFNPNPRQRFMVWAALKVAWKQPEWAMRIAGFRRTPLLMFGDGQVDRCLPGCIDLPAIPPNLFYDVVGRAEALVSAVPSMGMLEAAAAGTPSLALVADEFVAHCITGFVIPDWQPMDTMVAQFVLSAMSRQQMRDWVAAMRSADGMARDFEAVCERAMRGEHW